MKGRIKLSKAIKRATDSCPKGFSELANTDEFVGPAGNDGTNREDGANGVLGYRVVTELVEKQTIAGNNGGRALIVDCPEGTAATGGSCESSSGLFHMSESYLTSSGWRCGWRNVDSNQQTADFEAKVICATTPS